MARCEGTAAFGGEAAGVGEGWSGGCLIAHLVDCVLDEGCCENSFSGLCGWSVENGRFVYLFALCLGFVKGQIEIRENLN